jgi:GNAT superfamily N-acetyltransferase
LISSRNHLRFNRLDAGTCIAGGENTLEKDACEAFPATNDRIGEKMNANEIIPLQRGQIRHCADILSRAFFADPFFAFILPDERKRLRVLPWLYQKLLAYGHRYGRVETTQELAGAAIWFGPHHTSLKLHGVLRTGLFLLPLKLSRQEFRRSTGLANLSDQLHRETISSAHFYLAELGVAPALHGRGLGAALVKSGLARADHLQLPCYLETYNPDNLSFYASLGFRPVERRRFSLEAPQIWGMLREPPFH